MALALTLRSLPKVQRQASYQELIEPSATLVVATEQAEQSDPRRSRFVLLDVGTSIRSQRSESLRSHGGKKDSHSICTCLSLLYCPPDQANPSLPPPPCRRTSSRLPPPMSCRDRQTQPHSHTTQLLPTPPSSQPSSPPPTLKRPPKSPPTPPRPTPSPSPRSSRPRQSLTTRACWWTIGCRRRGRRG
jgi:hypothetical protein